MLRGCILFIVAMVAYSKKSITSLHVFIALLVLLLSFASSLADLHRIDHLPKDDMMSLSFLVVGDWGRKGNYNQTEVAAQMGIVGEKLNTEFIVSVGDNFYENGLTGVFDPAFRESFTNIYTANSLQKPWYIVMGNHDYRGDVEAQLNPILRQMDKRWNCKRSFIVNTGIAELFFIDTTPFVDKYFIRPKEHDYDWDGVLPREEYLADVLKDLELALMESTACWKIVVGHHTIKSAGQHGNTDELVRQLLPILEANNVDLYINGHDHCLEHISSSNSPIQFLTSGGGSKAWRGDVNWWDPQEMKFYYDGQGFMSVQLALDEIKIAFYDIFGNVLHKWSSSKQLRSSV